MIILLAFLLLMLFCSATIAPNLYQFSVSRYAFTGFDTTRLFGPLDSSWYRVEERNVSVGAFLPCVKSICIFVNLRTVFFIIYHFTICSQYEDCTTKFTLFASQIYWAVFSLVHFITLPRLTRRRDATLISMWCTT